MVAKALVSFPARCVAGCMVQSLVDVGRLRVRLPGPLLCM